MARASSNETAPVVHVYRYTWVRVNISGVGAEAVEHYVAGDDRIDFDAVGLACAKDERREQVAASTRSDHQRVKTLRSFGEVVGKCGQFIAEVTRVFQAPGALEDRGGCRRVDVHEQRLRFRTGVARTERPVPMIPVVDGNPRERIPLREQDAVTLMAFRIHHVERPSPG